MKQSQETDIFLGSQIEFDDHPIQISKQKIVGRAIKMTSLDDKNLRLAARRTFLGNSISGLGLWAANSLLAQEMNRSLLAADSLGSELSNRRGSDGPLGAIHPLHHPAKCKRVIFLYMAGGPSHLETFDNKPKLLAMHGQPMPESFTKGQQLAQLQGAELKCFGPQYGFERYGNSGQEISTLFPGLGSVADDLCIVRSMYTEQINHDPAHTFMNSGAIVAGRPSMGSWLLYGLGSESKDLPGFIVLTSAGRGGQMQPIASRQWSSGFLPSKYQGVKLSSIGDAVLHIRSPQGITSAMQRESIDVINSLNRLRFQTTQDQETLTRIAQYELAFKMQSSVPGLVDVSDESSETLEMYGAKPGDGSFAYNCLLARRLAQRGVRFIQLYHRDWDHHGNLKADIQLKAEETDRPTAALIKDLKRLGMLEDTLVVFAGEFGRTPMSQGGNGRDHHIKGFSIAMAGGGIRGGLTYGSTDELGYAAQENPVSVHDLHATMLHLLGIDHTRMTVKFQGLDWKLTGVEESRVVHDLIA
jgi:hypothetical protein